MAVGSRVDPQGGADRMVVDGLHARRGVRRFARLAKRGHLARGAQSGDFGGIDVDEKGRPVLESLALCGLCLSD